MFDKKVVKDVKSILESCVEFACKDKQKEYINCVFFRFNEKQELIELVANDAHTLVRYVNTQELGESAIWSFLSSMFVIEDKSLIKQCTINRSREELDWGLSVSLDVIKKLIKLLPLDGEKTQITLNKNSLQDINYPPYLNVIPTIEPQEECQISNFINLNPKYLARLERPFNLCKQNRKFLFQGLDARKESKPVLWKGSNTEMGLEVEAVIMPLR